MLLKEKADYMRTSNGLSTSVKGLIHKLTDYSRLIKRVMDHLNSTKKMCVKFCLHTLTLASGI